MYWLGSASAPGGWTVKVLGWIAGARIGLTIMPWLGGADGPPIIGGGGGPGGGGTGGAC